MGEVVFLQIKNSQSGLVNKIILESWQFIRVLFQMMFLIDQNLLPFGLSMLGMEDEYTPIRKNGTLNISPTKILVVLYKGNERYGKRSRRIRQLLKDKNKLRKITRVAFKAVDLDGIGYLERNQLEQVIIQVAQDIEIQDPTKQEIDQVMKQLDKSGDIKVDFRGISRTYSQSLINMAEYDN